MTKTLHSQDNPFLTTTRRVLFTAGAASLSLAMILSATTAAAQTTDTAADSQVEQPAAQQEAAPQAEDAAKVDNDTGTDAETAYGFVSTEGPVAALTELGIYESAYGIAAQLYLQEQQDLARDHLAGPDELSYAEISETLAEYEAPGFEAEHEAFIAAISGDASFEQVVDALNAVTDALLVASFSISTGLQDEILSLKDLVFLSAIEFENAVDEGMVVDAAGYRASWGYYETARRRAVSLSEALDTTWANAGKDVVESLAGLDEMFPDLTSDLAGWGALPLFAAAGKIEAIAQR